MKIHYIQPFDTNSPPNIGGAINAAIVQLNADADDWICNLDSDVLWLLPHSKAQLESILRSTEFDILGPRMNRLGNDYQLVEGAFNRTDILEHIQVAEALDRGRRGEVTTFTSGPLAAACLCFQVKTWKVLGGFNEKSLAFDTQFCNRAARAGMRLGIMQGIYILHLYRMGKDINNIDHLL